MNYKHNPSLTSNARVLRKNMTPQERRLWHDFLKNYPVHFLRQKIIDNYICDFYCSKAKLVIELDGNQHHYGKSARYDLIREKALKERVILVLRYDNEMIDYHFEKVVDEIDEIVQYRLNL